MSNNQSSDIESLHLCERPLEQLNISFHSENSENCNKCLSKDIKINFLQKRLALLNEIIRTSDLIAQFNDSIISEQTQLLDQSFKSENLMLDLSEEIECEIITITPQSHVVINQVDDVEVDDFLVEDVVSDSLVVDNDIMDKVVSQEVVGNEVVGNKVVVDEADVSNLSLSAAVEINTPNPRDKDPNLFTAPVYDPITPGPMNISLTCTPCSVKPVTLLDGGPFSKFSLDLLMEELEFSHCFKNRKSAYFGDSPYEYSGATHEPKTVHHESYLAKLRSYINVILPNLRHNSILINLYETGAEFMPAHSDSESCIEEDSDIVTISLGATRTLQLRSNSSNEVVGSVQLQHGDVFIMSKLSQADFQHEILPDEMCDEPRISITLRLMKPPRITQSTEFGPRLPPQPSPIPHAGIKQTHSFSPALPVCEQPASKKSILFISSSMFRLLDEEKLSSSTVSASKLFYSGADASVMLSKLKTDLSSVPTPSTIYLMTGTNNVNSIYFGSKSLKNAAGDISNLLNYLKSVYPNATINVINILPRSMKGRNDIVGELNKLIKDMCDKELCFNYMSTQHLFNYSRSGFRKEFYFDRPSAKISDNCHLNTSGVIRLAKFLKYWAHKQV